MVLLAHLNGTQYFPNVDWFVKFIDVGYLGVSVFFVISGFLISGLLFEEHKRTGKVNLLDFYMRRSFRIFPAYYTLAAIMAISGNLGWIQLRPGDLIAALTYTMNYRSDRAWCLGHSWSLAVEEQFYVIWPITLLLLNPRRGLLAAGAFVIIVPFVRFGLWHFSPSLYPKSIIGNSFETTADSIAIGCILAGVRDWLWGNPMYRRWLRSPWFLAVPFIGLIMMSTAGHPRLFAWAYSVAILCIAITLDRCIRFPSGIVGSVLNSRSLVYIGGLSYSIYLWQQPFLNRQSRTWWTSFPVNFMLAITFAILSYYLVERPGLRLRQEVEARFRRRHTEMTGIPIGPGPSA